MRTGNTIITGPTPLSRLGRIVAALALACVLAAPLAACGNRGDPMRPDRDGQAFPKTYPDPKTFSAP